MIAQGVLFYSFMRVQDQIFDFCRRGCDEGCTGISQLLPVAVSEQDTDGVQAILFSTDDIVFPVTDHNGGGFVGYIAAFQRVTDDVCLFIPGIIHRGTGDKVEIITMYEGEE